MSDSSEEAVFKGCLQSLLEAASPPPEFEVQVCECLRDLQAAVRDLLCGQGCPWKVMPFGGAVNGFADCSSDLDVTICSQSCGQYDESDKEGSVDVLKQLWWDFERNLELIKVKSAVLRARIPLLKLQYGETLDVDLSVNNPGGVRNTWLLKAYAAMEPKVVQLGLTVKLWAKGNRILGAWSRHLSPYAFLLMVIYFLQVGLPNPLPCLQRMAQEAAFDEENSALLVARSAQKGWSLCSDITRLFCGFISFYAVHFNWRDEVVCIRHGCRQYRPVDNLFGRVGRQDEVSLYIQEPFRPDNLADALCVETEQDLRAMFQSASEAIQEGRYLALFPQLTEASARPLQVGLTAVAINDFSNPSALGYLTVRPGDAIKVLHVGADDDFEEKQWAYGECVAGSACGWIPKQVLMCGPKPESSDSNVCRTWSAVVAGSSPGRGPGYLRLNEGEVVVIEYVGCDSNGDGGWLFGRTENCQSGWFLTSVLAAGSGQRMVSEHEVVRISSTAGDTAHHLHRDSGLSKRLRKAAACGDAPLVTQLLRERADVQHADGGGKTALHYASGAGERHIVELLLVWGANPNSKDKQGSLPADEADYWCVKPVPGDTGDMRQKCLSVLEVLFSNGGGRSEISAQGDGVWTLHRRRQLERIAEARGIEVPWRMERYRGTAIVDLRSS